MKTFNLTILLGLTLLLSSCAEAIPLEIVSETEPANFWRGIIHGFISPFAFIISFFKEEVAIYAINNNGAWYNGGFLLGASMMFGGGCKASKSKHRKGNSCC